MDTSLLNRLVNYCHISKGDIVLEIGAGLGFLTSILADSAEEVLAVEIDSSLIKILKDRVNKRNNVRIIEGDVLNLPPLVFHKVVANPPYVISSQLLMTLLDWDFNCAVLTLQLEFAEKLAAHEGESNYGPLSVLARYFGKTEILDHIPSDAFYPAPKIESALVRITPQPPPFHIRDKEVLKKLVKSLFTQRRRKTRNGLEHFLRNTIRASKKEAVILLEFFPHTDKRIVDLKPVDFGDLANIAVDLIRGKRIEYGGLIFYIFPDVYQPSDDTFLLARNLNILPNKKVLEVGCGCGLLGILAASQGNQVTAVDINPFAVECSRLNAKINRVHEKFHVKLSNLFEELNGEKFDIIVFNPPYLPQEKEEKTEGWLEKAWQGGLSGTEVIERFVNEVHNHVLEGGEIIMVISSISNPENTISGLGSQGFDVTVVAREKLDFEELYILKAR